MIGKIGVARLSLLVLFGGFLLGCATKQTGSSSSVVDYLYPSSNAVEIKPSLPHLQLPLKVGVAFVPETSSGSGYRDYWAGRIQVGALDEGRKSKLLDRVAADFRKLEFVESIEVIPSAYLRPGGSFKNLDQIKSLYNLDVVALVSYDQAQFTDEGFLSLSYWTLIGAYIVSGEKNDTSTLMDTTVYDIESRQLLFRAPGTNVVKGRSTPVNLSEELRKDSIESFRLAATDMTANLKKQLEAFQAKVKNKSSDVKVSHREGYSGGGGSISFMMLTFLILLFFSKKVRKCV